MSVMLQYLLFVIWLLFMPDYSASSKENILDILNYV